MYEQVITPSNYTPDMSSLRLCEESELRRGDVIGSGAFGTVYKVLVSTENSHLEVQTAINSAPSIKYVNEIHR